MGMTTNTLTLLSEFRRVLHKMGFLITNIELNLPCNKNCGRYAVNTIGQMRWDGNNGILTNQIYWLLMERAQGQNNLGKDLLTCFKAESLDFVRGDVRERTTIKRITDCRQVSKYIVRP